MSKVAIGLLRAEMCRKEYTLGKEEINLTDWHRARCTNGILRRDDFDPEWYLEAANGYCDYRVDGNYLIKRKTATVKSGGRIHPVIRADLDKLRARFYRLVDATIELAAHGTLQYQHAWINQQIFDAIAHQRYDWRIIDVHHCDYLLHKPTFKRKKWERRHFDHYMCQKYLDIHGPRVEKIPTFL